jgi:hypothetical protein
MSFWIKIYFNGTSGKMGEILGLGESLLEVMCEWV